MSSLSSTNTGTSAGARAGGGGGLDDSVSASEVSASDVGSSAAPCDAGDSVRTSRGRKKFASGLSVKFKKGVRGYKKMSASVAGSDASSAASKRQGRRARVTAEVAKQVELGEDLLESLYPGLAVDAENICPKCSSALGEADLASGWGHAGTSSEYETRCPSCGHGFVPNFSVECKSPAFEGSQGRGTPLYCDLLSPWVLLREIRSAVDGRSSPSGTAGRAQAGGVDDILDEKFRSGGDIRATLWW